MNIAMKHLRILVKSAAPRAIGVTQDGRRFSFQKRDYGGITDESWKSAVLDTTWLARRYAGQITNSRLIHFSPSMDGSVGLPFENGINRFESPSSVRQGRPATSTCSTKQGIKSLIMTKVIGLGLGQPQPSISKSQLSNKSISDSVIHGDILARNKDQQSSSPGADDEALFFSTNFVIIAFLFLILALARDA